MAGSSPSPNQLGGRSPNEPKAHATRDHEEGTTAPRLCAPVQAPFGMSHFAYSTATKYLGKFSDSPVKEVAWPYSAPPAPHRDRTTPRPSPRPTSDTQRSQRRRDADTVQGQAGPSEGPASKGRHNTTRLRSHENEPPPQGNSTHLPPQGMSSPRVAVDSGALLANLEEQRQYLIQDQQDLEAVLNLRTEAISRENREAGGSSHHLQVLLQCQEQDSSNLTLISGRILQLNNTTAAIGASCSRSPGVPALARPGEAPTMGGRPNGGDLECGGGSPARGGPARHLPSSALVDQHSRAINHSSTTCSGGYMCLLCNKKACWPHQQDIQEHLGSKHGGWFRARWNICTTWLGEPRTHPASNPRASIHEPTATNAAPQSAPSTRPRIAARFTAATTAASRGPQEGR